MSFSDMRDGYVPPFWAINAHVETIAPALFRPAPRLDFVREKLPVPDGDELWMNWLRRGFEKLAVLIPGLESDANRAYNLNMAQALCNSGFDILIPDHRGGKYANKLFRSYHSGNTGDLDLILRSGAVKRYRKLYLIGFSLGGNIVLKYLGEQGAASAVAKAAAVCTPFDLSQCSAALALPQNRLYSRRFLKSMKRRVKIKLRSFPGAIDEKALEKCATVRDFDDVYTAPAHGFSSAESYYAACSSRNFLAGIVTPTLALNALNDPMIPLDEEVIDALRQNRRLTVVLTRRGGHLGYPQPALSGVNWYEKQILSFFAAG